MQNAISRFFFTTLTIGVFSATAYSSTVDVGTAAFNVTNSPLAEVDLVNLTGVNSNPDFPITTAVSFSNLTLTVDFQTGSPETFGSSSGYFTSDSLNPFNFDGADIFNTSSDPVTQVTVTGDFSPTSVTITGMTGVQTITSTFSATITDSSGVLGDGDFALITTSTGGVTPPPPPPPPPPTTPEPGTYMLLGIGFLALGLFTFRRSKLSAGSTKALQNAGLVCLGVCFAVGVASASTPVDVQLATTTSPESGVSGTSNIWVTGSGFPSGTFGTVTVSVASKCAAAGTTTTAIAERTIVGSTDRIEFLVPATLATGTYFVSVSGSTSGGTFTSGSSCSQVIVTHTSSVLASCNPGSSMGILSYNAAGKGSTPVSAYVPNGYWSGGTSGVQVVPLEGAGSPETVPTTNPINSCSSNSITGETVCIDNYTGIYLLQGSSISKTLTSGATGYASFSGGSCENCTVAVNEAAGTKGEAVIGIGYAGAPGESALQFVDLASNTLGTPVPMTHIVSEDILWDPFRNAVLSPNEGGVYDLFQASGSGLPGPSSVKELSNDVTGEFDSAGEDCTTQIALASIEFSSGLYITDLSQKSVTGSDYTAPGQTLSMPEFGEFSAGTDGIAVAPGSTHLGVITGEFGGNQFAAFALPSTSGKGTPAVVDYVAAALPATPDGCSYASGYDPHTTTAYTSPNSGKAYGVMADWAEGEPSYVAVVDLQGLLKAPRKKGIYPSGDSCSTCVNTVDPTYDLVKNGVVTYVPTGNKTCSSPAAIHADAVRAVHVNKLPVTK